MSSLQDLTPRSSSVTATAVAIPGIDMEACRRVAGKLGVEFREREYNEVG